jgi:hypothetical protein
VRAAGFQITAVLGDAEFGDNTLLRRALHRWQLPYALGISSTLTMFRGTCRRAAAQTPRRPSSHAIAGNRREPTGIGARHHRSAATARLVTRLVAQWHQSTVDGGLCRAACHTRARLASASPRSRSVAAPRTRSRDDPTRESVSRVAVTHGHRCAHWSGWPITAGRSNSSTSN